MQHCDELIADNIALLKQGAELIRQIGCAYSTPAGPILHAGVGGHFRHCIDFYKCFLGGLSDGRIDYDKRPRNELLELDGRLAIKSIETVVQELEELTVDGGCAVEVVLEGRLSSRSSVARELQSLLSHTVHHYALIAIALKLQGIQAPGDFGVAPSTLAYWRKTA